jgi:hypothetical protein
VDDSVTKIRLASKPAPQDRPLPPVPLLSEDNHLPKGSLSKLVTFLHETGTATLEIAKGTSRLGLKDTLCFLFDQTLSSAIVYQLKDNSSTPFTTIPEWNLEDFFQHDSTWIVRFREPPNVLRELKENPPHGRGVPQPRQPWRPSRHEIEYGRGGYRGGMHEPPLTNL